MTTARAFTRNQLLVAILASLLLLALAIPFIAHTRTAHRRSVCLGNLRHLASVFHEYSVDYGIFLSHPLEEPSVQQNYWTHTLSRYIEPFPPLLQCPEALDPNPRLFTPGTATSPWNQTDSARNRPQTGAYTINGWLYTANFSSRVYLGDESDFLAAELRTDDLPPLPTIIDPASFYHAPVARPSTVPLFADAIWSETFPAPAAPPPANTTTRSGPAITFHLGQLFIARHNTSTPAINIAFLDGHAETTPLSTIPTLPWQSHWIPSSPAAAK